MSHEILLVDTRMPVPEQMAALDLAIANLQTDMAIFCDTFGINMSLRITEVEMANPPVTSRKQIQIVAVFETMEDWAWCRLQTPFFENVMPARGFSEVMRRTKDNTYQNEWRFNFPS